MCSTEVKQFGCGNCPFRGKKIGSKGNPKAKIVVVGESPGANELAAGMPFMGPSGKLLDSTLPENMDILYTNALSCLPLKKDPKILANAVSCCRSRLIDEIAEYPRDIIIAMGNGALWGLTGDYNLKITQERGKRFPSELATHGIVASVHPAFLLRGGGSLKKFQEDLRYGVSLAMGYTIKSWIEPKTNIVETEEQAHKLAEVLMDYEYIACDIETAGFNRRKDKIISIGFAFNYDDSYIVKPEHFQIFKQAFESKQIHWIWQNGKFDIAFIRKQLDIEARVDEDTMLLNYALDETRGIHDLDTIASDVLGAPNHKDVIPAWFDANMPGLKKAERSYDKLPFDLLAGYQAKDLGKTLQIFNNLRPKVAADPALEKLYTKTLIPVSELLYHIEMRGFMFDWDRWQENKARLEIEVDGLLREIQAVMGYSINPNSSQQVGKYVYDELGIKVKGGGRSTDAKTVLLWPDFEFKHALQKYRKATKALSTYINGMAEHVHADDGRIHPTFLIHGTRTGRLSCREPNLQNIPRDPRLKGMFKAAPGYILVDLDASQAELRSLAIQSGDPDLIEIYNSTDRSLHKEVAIALFGVDYDEDQYVRAKAVNFGIVYGRSAYTLAEEFKITEKEAQAMIDKWFARFPVAHAFIEKCRAAPLKRQTLVTVFGRKCRPGMISRENMNAVQNEFSNFPHQSTASDITLHVAMLIRNSLDVLDAGIVDLVHDSIVVECPDNPEAIAAVKKLGEEGFPAVALQWGLTKVPFKADCKLNYNWGNPIKAAA